MNDKNTDSRDNLREYISDLEEDVFNLSMYYKGTLEETDVDNSPSTGTLTLHEDDRSPKIRKNPRSIDKLPQIQPQGVTIFAGVVIASICMFVSVFHVLSLASPRTLVGISLGGCIVVIDFVFGPLLGALSMVIGLLLGSFIGSGMYWHRGALSYQVGRANEERMIAALRQLNKIAGQSEPTDENQ